MKKKIISLVIVILLIFIFLIFFKGLNKSNIYKPKSLAENIPQFSVKSFLSNEVVNSKKIFNGKKFYLLNIWASWCVPCREEHSLLVSLSKNKELEIIGLNYRDKFDNAKKFLNDLGNPYTKIYVDQDGTKAIEWGAFGVPETFLIHQNKIIKKFIGPLNASTFKEIQEIIK